MKLIYIAGKLNDKTGHAIEQNIRVAEDLSLEVAETGNIPVCPHTQSRFLMGTLTELYWIEATKKIMLACEAVVLCYNWESSPGTIGEIVKAKQVGIPVYESVHWMRERVQLSADDPRLVDACRRFGR